MLAIVPHEERAAIGEPAGKMNDPPAIQDAVAGLEKETASAFHGREFTRMGERPRVPRSRRKTRGTWRTARSGDERCHAARSGQGTVRPPSTTSVWPVT